MKKLKHFIYKNSWKFIEKVNNFSTETNFSKKCGLFKDFLPKKMPKAWKISAIQADTWGVSLDFLPWRVLSLLKFFVYQDCFAGNQNTHELSEKSVIPETRLDGLFWV